MAESKIEKDCKKIARADGWYVRKFSSPARKGVPDDIFIKAGRHVFVEFKNPGNEPTLLQWIDIIEINEHGGEAYWCDDIDLFKELLDIDVPDDANVFMLKMQYSRCTGEVLSNLVITKRPWDVGPYGPA